MKRLLIPFRWLRSLVCSHEVYYDTDMKRINPTLVTCPCFKCGKLLTAEYGLDLNAQLRRRNR